MGDTAGVNRVRVQGRQLPSIIEKIAGSRRWVTAPHRPGIFPSRRKFALAVRPCQGILLVDSTGAFLSGKDRRMRGRTLAGLPLLAALAAALSATRADAACCYFSAKNTDIQQPAQKVFITWDPVKKSETFTVQPKFSGNALDFGMVIP